MEDLGANYDNSSPIMNGKDGNYDNFWPIMSDEDDDATANNDDFLQRMEAEDVASAQRQLVLAVMKMGEEYGIECLVDLLKAKYEVCEEEMENMAEPDMKRVMAAAAGIPDDLSVHMTELIDDPQSYIAAYEHLKKFIEQATPACRYELYTMLSPILVKMFFKLVHSGFVAEGRSFLLENFHDIEDHAWRQDLKALLDSDLNSELLKSIAVDKFVIRLSERAHALLKDELKNKKYNFLAEILVKQLTFDIRNDENRVNLFITTTRQVEKKQHPGNKSIVLFGVNKQVEEEPVVKKKGKFTKPIPKNFSVVPDFSVPAPNRIPLPELRPHEKAQKLKALQELARNCATLNRNNLPSALMRTIFNSQDSIRCVEMSEDATILALGSDHSHIIVYSLTDKKLLEMKKPEKLKKLDVNHKDVRKRMMDERSGKEKRTLYGHSGPVYNLSISANKELLLSCSFDRRIHLWSLLTWSLVVIYRGHMGFVLDVKFAMDGYYFVTGGADRSARVWATDDHQAIRILGPYLCDVSCVQFHPNSNYVATAADEHVLRLYDISDGKCVRVMTGHLRKIHAIIFSACGRYLVSGGADGYVIIWDLLNGSLVQILQQHQKTVRSLALSRQEGNILASAGMDRCLALWDFNEIIEHYLARNDDDDDDDASPLYKPSKKHLIKAYYTKSTPILKVIFDRTNLIHVSGPFTS